MIAPIRAGMLLTNRLWNPAASLISVVSTSTPPIR